MTATKICGLTRPDDVAYAVGRGADYVGMVFWPGSKRAIDRARGRVLAGCARAARPDVKVVGVFVDAPVAEVEATARACRLDVVQLHGDEPVADGAALTAAGFEVWKAIAIAGPADLARLAAWPAAAHLLDAASPARGGTGQTIDWGLAAEAVAVGHRIVLAGGLTPHNVATAIAAVRPFAVDVASGVERAPGDKDPTKVFQFLDAAQRQLSYLRR